VTHYGWVAVLVSIAVGGLLFCLFGLVALVALVLGSPAPIVWRATYVAVAGGLLPFVTTGVVVLVNKLERP
jgi:hypothetical protein